MLFALLNIGTYINGTINSSLVDTYPTNIPSGNFNNTYWHNASGNKTESWRNTSLPAGCNIGYCDDSTQTSFNVYNNGTIKGIWVNLTVNGDYIYNTTIPKGTWRNTTLASLVTAGNVSASDLYLNWTWQANSSTNKIRIRQVAVYYQSGDLRTSLENGTVDSLYQISGKYDDTVEIMGVAAIITVITMPLAAVVAVRKLF